MLTAEIIRDEPLLAAVESQFDWWSERLSLSLIRRHTKTDDVPGVTDEQLRFYRSCAVEAAELYTGLILSARRTVTEPVAAPSSYRFGKRTYKHRLRYPAADGVIYIYGGSSHADSMTFHLAPGARVIPMPVRTDVIDLTNCCNPCSSQYAINGSLVAQYVAGYACAADVPASVVLGCLQFIAWIVQHPGDEILTMRNRMEARSEGSGGSNNVAVISGALETWRTLDEDIV